MSKDKKSLADVLPKDKKDNMDQYPDHLKSPLHDLKDKRKVAKEHEE